MLLLRRSPLTLGAENEAPPSSIPFCAQRYGGRRAAADFSMAGSLAVTGIAPPSASTPRGSARERLLGRAADAFLRTRFPGARTSESPNRQAAGIPAIPTQSAGFRQMPEVLRPGHCPQAPTALATGLGAVPVFLLGSRASDRGAAPLLGFSAGAMVVGLHRAPGPGRRRRLRGRDRRALAIGCSPRRAGSCPTMASSAAPAPTRALRPRLPRPLRP